MKNNNIVKNILKSIVPIVLLISGVIVFTARFPGWSLLIGLPMIVISTVFLIFTYDDLSQKLTDNEFKNMAKCSICGSITSRDLDVPEEDTICSICQMRMSKLFGKKKSSNI